MMLLGCMCKINIETYILLVIDRSHIIFILPDLWEWFL